MRNRPLSRREGTRASEARSQGYAGGDAGADGLDRLIRFSMVKGEGEPGARDGTTHSLYKSPSSD